MSNCNEHTVHLSDPQTITGNSENRVTSLGHSHEISKASQTTAGIVKVVDHTESTEPLEALSANQGRILAEALREVVQYNKDETINQTLDAALGYLATRLTASYSTLALAQANAYKHAEASLIYVVNDVDVTKCGLYTIQGGQLVKAPWDALSSALTSEPFEVLHQIMTLPADSTVGYQGNTYFSLATLSKAIADGQTEISEIIQTLANANGLLSRYILTDSGKTQEEVNAEISLKAPQATTYTKNEVDASLATKAPQSNTYTKTEVDTALTVIAGGHKAYQTLAAAQAAQASLPANTVVEVTNDGANNGTYQWNGTTLTKSAYDPLTQAKKYADNLSANNVIKVADAISADASKNLYNTTNDAADFYITDSTSVNPGLIKSLAGTRLQVMPVKAGESYLFSAPALSGLLSVSFSADPIISANKSVTLATVITVSSSIKKLVVPAGMNYLFFNTKIPTLSFDVTTSLVVNKFKSIFIGYGEAVVADETAREAIAILETEALMGSDMVTPNYFPNLAIDEIAGVYITAVGSAAGVGKFASYVDSAIQRISVEAGKTYAIYSDNFDNTRFTVTASDSSLTTIGKQNTVLTLSDTSNPKVKTFTVPASMNFVFMTVYIKTLNFDMRSIIWVNEGQNSTKGVVLSVTGIKGFQIRDPLAQQRLDDLNIVQTSVLKNKTWIAIGDSITEKNMRANKNYHDYIKEDVGGMTVFNRGVSGSGFHDRMNVADTLTQQNPDYITIFWGTNDFGLVRNTYPLGTFMNNDENTISGRINTCLNALITKYPLAKIAIISALPRLTNWGSNAAPNGVGYTLKQHVDLLKQYAAHYSLPFLNLYEQSNLPVWIPAANEYYFTAPTLTTPDGLHPNDAGQRVMADKIKAFLESI